MMTKDGGNVHAPVTLTVYAEDTNSNKEFVEPTMKITEKKKERTYMFWGFGYSGRPRD